MAESLLDSITKAITTAKEEWWQGIGREFSEDAYIATAALGAITSHKPAFLEELPRHSNKQSETMEKIEAAMNADPIEIPSDKKGYFAWLKSSQQSGAHNMTHNVHLPEGHYLQSSWEGKNEIVCPHQPNGTYCYHHPSIRDDECSICQYLESQGDNRTQT